MEIMGGQDWIITARTVRNWNRLTVRLAGAAVLYRWSLVGCRRRLADPDHLIPDLV